MKKIVSAVLLALAVGGASAQIYVGGNIGSSHLNVDSSGTTDHKDNDTGYKLYAGYTINKTFAVEAGYLDFGKATATVPSQFGLLDSKQTTNAPFLVGVARADFTPQLSGVARLGFANVKSTLDVTQVSSGITVSESNTQAKALFGLALEYALTQNIKVSVDADFTNSAEIEGEKGAIRLLSIGARYSF